MFYHLLCFKYDSMYFSEQLHGVIFVTEMQGTQYYVRIDDFKKCVIFVMMIEDFDCEDCDDVGVALEVTVLL